MPSVGSGCETCCLGPRTAGTTVHLFFPLPGFHSASGRRVSCTLWLVIYSEHGFQGIWGLVLWGCSAPLDDGLNSEDGWGNWGKGEEGALPKVTLWLGNTLSGLRQCCICLENLKKPRSYGHATISGFPLHSVCPDPHSWADLLPAWCRDPAKLYRRRNPALR